jgi:hypothetical protein
LPRDCAASRLKNERRARSEKFPGRLNALYSQKAEDHCASRHSMVTMRDRHPKPEAGLIGYRHLPLVAPSSQGQVDGSSLELPLSTNRLPSKACDSTSRDLAPIDIPAGSTTFMLTLGRRRSGRLVARRLLRQPITASGARPSQFCAPFLLAAVDLVAGSRKRPPDAGPQVAAADMVSKDQTPRFHEPRCRLCEE